MKAGERERARGRRLSGWGSRAALRIQIIIAVSGLAAQVGCLTNGSTGSSFGDGVTATTTLTGNTSEDSSYIKLSNVLPNASNPTTVFDLVGDGSGAFGSNCTADSSGKSNCACEYNYIRSSGSEETFEVDTTYVESDLIRCKYDTLPTTDLSYVQVRVHFTASDTYSTQVSYKFGANSATLDLTDDDSFALVQRYQCKDVVFVPHVFDSNIYDPYQSEDAQYAYPLNFYTTNMGAAIAAYAAKNTDAQWDCPPIPNDSAAGLDLTLFSVTSDGASKQIYPGTGSTVDRSTFYLAKKSSGSFTLAVNAMLAPNVNTVTPDSTGSVPSGSYAPIGYAAKPVSTSSGGETCPTDVDIPSGYHWVKVWLFRASLPARYAAGSGNVFNGTAVSCNPGAWEGEGSPAAASTSIYADCSSAAYPYQGYTRLTTGGIADRLITTLEGIGLCARPYNVDGAGTAGFGYTTTSSLTQKSGYSSFATGTDYWTLVRGDDDNTGNLNTYNLRDGTYNGVPHDPKPTQVSIDDGVSRFDFLFVVTPETVMVSDMKNATSTSLPYTPYRFVPASACSSTDPDAPATSGDCPSNKRINYQIRLTDLAANPDSSGEDTSRLPAFPACAIQPD